MNTQTITEHRVHWRQVSIFLVLTFALSWGLNLVLYLTGGYVASAATGMLLQAQMLVPAFVAILLLVFVFSDSPVYFRRFQERSIWFFYFYLVFTLIFLGFALAGALLPEQANILSAIAGSLNILALLVLIAMRAFFGRDAFARAGLVGGKPRHWLLWGLAFMLFYALQVGLNAAFGLGTAVDTSEVIAALGVTGMSENIFLLAAFVQTVLVGPFLGLLLAFGEEFGWRGYLQWQFIRLGKVRGILLLGIIWGIWHYPVILMGHNYPGEPVWGIILMTGYTIALAFILGHVMFKTGAIWLVAFLHAVNNQTLSFFYGIIHTPNSPVWSFGAGVFGVLTLGLVALLLLRDPVWREETGIAPFFLEEEIA